MSLLVNILCALVSLMMQEGADPQPPKIQIRTVVMKLVDEDGIPVNGAAVTAYALRTRENPGSHWLWQDRIHGSRPTSRSNADGQTGLFAPIFTATAQETGQVTVRVDHEDFVVTHQDISVDENPAEITLSRGRRIAATAVDAQTGQRIATDLFAMLSDAGWESEWKLTENGTLLSRAMDWNRTSLRVLHLPADGPARFSDPVRLNREDRTLRVLLSDIPVHSGVRLEGRLQDSVPRPIVDGYAIVTLIDGSPEDAYSERGQWTDWVPITAEGTFVFDSLPRHSVAQVIAVCHGWISGQPTPQELTDNGMAEFLNKLNGRTTQPQLITLHESAAQLTVRMDPSASCRLTVLRPDGNPLANTEISFWPNQKWFGGTSQVLGDGTRSRIHVTMNDAQRVLTQRGRTSGNYDPLQLGIRSPGINRQRATTDANGVAVFSGLPGGTADSPLSPEIAVDHAEFELPAPGDPGYENSPQVRAVRGQISELTVHVRPKAAIAKK